MAKQADNGGMMDKQRYEQIRSAMVRHHLGEKLFDLKKDGNPLVYAWSKKYAVVVVGETHVLVERPKTKNAGEVGGGNEPAPTTDQDRLRRPTYLERLYNDMLSVHGLHNMCDTFRKRLAEKYSNVAMPWVKLFTSTCPGCIGKAKTQKPVSGLRNIITSGFGVRGQVDLIDLQSMADGSFRFLLNYIDHGIKVLVSDPMVAKRANCVAIILFQIFCLIGAPMILQTDNGREFCGIASTSKQRREDKRKDGEGLAVAGAKCRLSKRFLGEVITEIRKLWPECIMVRGSPRHSESNGGVERVNRTVQQKLAAWMHRNNSTQWSIGCKVVQFEINTQFHSTIKSTPYKLSIWAEATSWNFWAIIGSVSATDSPNREGVEYCDKHGIRRAQQQPP